MHLFCFYEGFIRGGIQRVFLLLLFMKNIVFSFSMKHVVWLVIRFLYQGFFSLASESVLLLVYCVFFSGIFSMLSSIPNIGIAVQSLYYIV